MRILSNLLSKQGIVLRAARLGMGLATASLVIGSSSMGVAAASGSDYWPKFVNPPTAPVKLSTPTPVSVDVTTSNGAPVHVNGAKLTLTPATLSLPNTLMINDHPPGQAVTLKTTNGVANFTVEAVYHTGPIRLTATVAGPSGPIHPVSTFVTVGKGNPPLVTRYAGNTRFGTAAQIAEASDPSGTKTVILSSGLNQNLVDALTAAPLSALLKAPILLTASNQTIGQDTLNTLTRLGARRVILIGAVDNKAVIRQLPSRVHVIGYAGPNRYATALKVALAIKAAKGNMSTLFFSSGNNANLTDALTIDPVAAERRSPVLLLPPKGGLPSGYAALLKSARLTYVVGAATGYHDSLPNEVAVAGADRYATAALVNQKFFNQPMGVVLTNADSGHLVDALTAGPLAGEKSFPIVMVSSTIIPGPTYDYLESIANSVSGIAVVGGVDSVSSLMTSAVQEMLR